MAGEDDQILSTEEVRRHFDRLRQADIVRLTALATTWTRGLGRRDPQDLLGEAMTRILSGQRPWPAHLSFFPFVSQVMRSISSQWRHDDAREPLLEEATELPPAAQGLEDQDFADLTRRMRACLEEDRAARGVFDHLLRQSDRRQAQAALGLDATSYDTARRRMSRVLHRHFATAWIL